MPQPVPVSHFGDLVPAALETDALPVDTNPVGRTIAELEILLAPLMSGPLGQAGRDARKWPMGQTIGFIVVSCGLFWATALALIWMVR